MTKRSRLSVSYEMVTIGLGIPIVYGTLLVLALAAALCLCCAGCTGLDPFKPQCAYCPPGPNNPKPVLDP